MQLVQHERVTTTMALGEGVMILASTSQDPIVNLRQFIVNAQFVVFLTTINGMISEQQSNVAQVLMRQLISY